MKSLIASLSLSALVLMPSTQARAAEVKVITVVESIVAAGIGRSRIIESTSDTDIDNLTSTHDEDGRDKKDRGRRKDAKVDDFKETKLLNFFSIAGINFQNIASNDTIITATINRMLKEGWDLQFVTSGVESDGGKTDKNGIFITRLFFKKG